MNNNSTDGNKEAAAESLPKGSFAAEMERVETRKEGREGREFEKVLAGRGKADKRPALYLPVHGLTERRHCYEPFYQGCAQTGRFFYRDEAFSYVEEDPEAGLVLRVLEPGELTAEIETVFSLRKKFIDKEGVEQERPVNLELKEALLILKDSISARKYSRKLRLLSASPILIERDGEPVILPRGYHADVGGVYVTGELEIPETTVEEAKTLLLDLVRDYDFVSRGDRSRAVAYFLSAALKLGNLLDTDYPFNVVISNREQSGKGHLFKMLAALYGETPYVITKTTGGVGSFDEKVSAALLSAKLFVIVDNARGDVDSQLLESILKGVGVVNVRVPYRGNLSVDARRCLWGLTSNVANFTRDLAARSIVVNHRKQAPGYKPQSSLGWGDVVLVRLAAQRALYLGAVYAVVAEWIRRGKPRSDETRHAFRDWVQPMDYIIREILGLAPLMEGQEMARAILSNRAYGWLREVALKVDETGQLGVPLQASAIGDLCEEEDITIPGLRETKASPLLHREDRNKQVGINLKKIFEDIPPIENAPKGTPEGLRRLELEGYEVERWEERAPGETKPVKKYRIVKKVCPGDETV